MKLFIVEDDEIQRLILEMMVTKMGFEVTGTEAYGNEAVNSILEHKPDIILLDVMLKDSFDGISVAEEIKKVYQPIIIYITGNSDETNINRAKKFGFHDYITKPVSLNELRNSILSIE